MKLDEWCFSVVQWQQVCDLRFRATTWASPTWSRGEEGFFEQSESTHNAISHCTQRNFFPDVEHDCDGRNRKSRNISTGVHLAVFYSFVRMKTIKEKAGEGAAATAPGDKVITSGTIFVPFFFFSKMIFVPFFFFSKMIYVLFFFFSKMIFVLFFFFFSKMIRRSYLRSHLVACGLVDHVDRRSDPPCQDSRLAVHHPYIATRIC